MEEVKNINRDRKFKKSFDDPKDLKERRPISDLTANKINDEAVKVELDVRGSQNQNTQREKINSIIQQVNIAVQTTEEISALFESITGIVEQAASDGATQDRLKTLELEAQGLAREVAKITDQGALYKDAPASDEQTLSEIEAKLSKVLNELFPEDSKPTIEAQDISFKSKDSITSTADKIRLIKEHLESITKNIKETSAEIRQAIELGEVVVENSEASAVLVRDVDQALEMAKKASLNINNDPAKALGAIALKSLRPELLKP